eukprot:TRINITY_DN81024_c0_g1_i1.p1 TRINITY_DN81024_c0_g1~~TRINITY_DN81024_c0_g1_i1.p1  ORF type:complete len:936 (-),score=293.81 TRINITY_DN81024_c0_g1_i1:54-2861(-)
MSSTTWTGAAIRKAYIDYFVEKQGHVFYASSPVVPHNDPTLLFTNAGMNQYKPIFLGQVDPASPLSTLKRAANSQKCIRAGGKHNDLDDVGKDTYHHTFFEMLGNWSFGDYFKKEAIEWAYDLLVNVFGLDKDRLYATYFGGCEEQGLKPDDEAKSLWMKFLPSERILPFGMKDNFWEMGDVGPCGPCSEIHYDFVGGRDASSYVNKDDPQVIEVWNLVFIQFAREAGGMLKSLPAKHVDTGLGMERLTSILQGKSSNYDTDIFTPYFEEIQRLTNAPAYSGKIGKEDVSLVDTAYRVIADHVRTLSFAIADGALPSSEGRGYVLRRILRRAVRYARQKLQAPENFLPKLVRICVEQMGDHFPELKKHQKLITDTLEDEEHQFFRTLDKGEIQFCRMVEGKRIVEGDDAFKLYDTYGFPVDLTQIMAEERGMKVDMEGYERAMERAKELSRAAGKQGGDETVVLDADDVDFLVKSGVIATDDQPKYGKDEIESKIVALFVPSQSEKFPESVDTMDFSMGIITEKTCFYAEAGGQMGDVGVIRFEEDNEFIVHGVQSWGGYVVHIGKIEKGSFSVGNVASLDVDMDRRKPTASNHTLTHALNFALRKVCGDGIDQKGSLVAYDRLRFDFNHNGPVSVEELEKVEKIVRDMIQEDLPVHKKVVPLGDARKISTLRAVFGETYPDPVRVVSIGVPVEEVLSNPEDSKWADISVELCGGTHLDRLSQAIDFVVISEEGIAKGIRRVVCFTRDMAQEALRRAEDIWDEIEHSTITPDVLRSLTNRVKKSVLPAVSKAALNAKLEEVRQDLQKKEAELKKTLTDWARSVDDVPFVVESLAANGDGKLLYHVMEALNKREKPIPVMLLSKGANGQVVVRSSVPKTYHPKGLTAKTWVDVILKRSNGKGGGKNDVAQGFFTESGETSMAVMKELAQDFANTHL